ncbi:DUF3800 domain-containing protein [Sphingomonas agri]|uniref:DUF3800 domain-containing protein n=1 Tax=Sphingomonas agri TaxID=1813878 RepID=UPI00311F88A9
MKTIIDVYCDESCHLENDGQSAMTLGALWLPDERKAEISARIAEIKNKHKMPSSFEVKWTKVSGSKVDLYMDLVDYFFDDDDLRFRCVVAPDKSALDHEKFQQSHDDWYYKMYFHLISFLLKPQYRYRIYLDIKDTRSKLKVKRLWETLSNSQLDFSRSMIDHVQQVRSHEVGPVQLADLLIGAMSYKARGMGDSAAKRKIVERIAARSGYSLAKSTLPKEDKFNILIWQAS